MNERIEELKHQASVWCDENIPEQFSEEINGYGAVWENKFAELIIKECAELTLDYKNNDHYNGWLDYRDEIKKHFGVE